MPLTNVDIAREVIETFNREGIEATLDRTHPEAEIHPFAEWPGPDRYEGHDGLVQLVGEWTENFDDYGWLPERYVEARGDTVVVLARHGGNAKDQGVPVDQPVAGVFRFDNGVIVRMDYFLTWEEALRFADTEWEPAP